MREDKYILTVNQLYQEIAGDEDTTSLFNISEAGINGDNAKDEVRMRNFKSILRLQYLASDSTL